MLNISFIYAIFVALTIISVSVTAGGGGGGVLSRKDEFISGHAFQSLANWSYCPRMKSNFVPERIKENDVVFINNDWLKEAAMILRKNRMDLDARKPGKFILIVGNSDVSFTQDSYDLLVDYTKVIYAVNAACVPSDCPLLTPIPLGFVDYPEAGYTHLFLKKIFADEYGKKRHLLYMNYAHSTNPELRLECTNTFLIKPYSAPAVRQFYQTDFPQWIVYESNIPRVNFFSSIIRSKFVLVPQGNGLDSHRIYECIFFNAIPIVLSSRLDHFYRKLPVLLVQSWSEVTEEYLRSNYIRVRRIMITWKRANSKWKLPKTWIDVKQFKRGRKGKSKDKERGVMDGVKQQVNTAISEPDGEEEEAS